MQKGKGYGLDDDDEDDDEHEKTGIEAVSGIVGRIPEQGNL